MTWALATEWEWEIETCRLVFAGRAVAAPASGMCFGGDEAERGDMPWRPSVAAPDGCGGSAMSNAKCRWHCSVDATSRAARRSASAAEPPAVGQSAGSRYIAQCCEATTTVQDRVVQLRLKPAFHVTRCQRAESNRHLATSIWDSNPPFFSKHLRLGRGLDCTKACILQTRDKNTSLRLPVALLLLHPIQRQSSVSSQTVAPLDLCSSGAFVHSQASCQYSTSAAQLVDFVARHPSLAPSRNLRPPNLRPVHQPTLVSFS